MSRFGRNSLNGVDVSIHHTKNERGQMESDPVTSASVRVPPRLPGQSGVRAGDMLILAHVADTASNAGFGQPNQVGNPWLPLLDQGQSGSGGGLRLRMWWKLVTEEEQAVATTYTVFTSGAHRQGLVSSGVPYWAFDPADGPPQVAVRAGTGRAIARAASFTMTDPDHPGRPWASIGSFHASNPGVATGASTLGQPSANIFFAASHYWWGRQGQTDRTSAADLWAAWGTSEMRRGDTSRGWNDFPTPTRIGTCAEIKVALLLKPYDYRLPTGTLADVRDHFDDPTTSLAPARVTTFGTGSASVVDGRLRLSGSVLYEPKTVFDLKGQGVVVDVGRIDGLDSTDGLFQLRLGIRDEPARSVPLRWTVAMMAVRRGERTLIRIYKIDEGTGADTFMGEHDPVATRWWRIREDGGVLLFETSPDNVTWKTGAILESTMLPDQLAATRLTLLTGGQTVASLDALAAPTVFSRGTVPTRRTLDWMGVTAANEDRWHGRDVLIGIVDQGTTREARAAKEMTLVRRRYFAGAPAGGAEIFTGQIHGTLVTPCAVPYGGRFVEAVCSEGTGGSSGALISASMRWCAEQGAKVVNVSWGGGPLEQVFISTAAYISANFDCEVYIAAGNSNQYGIAAPAVLSNAFSSFHSVGAFNELSSARAPFSNYHELLSGVAPGQAVAGLSPGGGILQWNGTSAAAPHAAGLCARLLTRGADPLGRRFTAAQAGLALDRTGRDTGSSRAEQGGGAYDLGRAIAQIGDATSVGNLPGVAMPRFKHGQHAGVADAFNRISAAVEKLGMHALLRYRADPVWAALRSGQRGIVPWDHADGATHTGMWDPDYGASVTIVEDGFYLILAQIRFGNLRLDDTYASTAPYSVGERVAWLMLNGEDPDTNSIAVDRKPGTTDGEGVTLTLVAQVPLRKDDWLFTSIRQTSGGTVECLQTDFGGCWFAVARIAPLGPTLVGDLPQVQGLVGSAPAWNQARLQWTNPPQEAYEGALIRRLTGTAGPQTIADGVHVGYLAAPGTEWVDGGRDGATTYSYSVFARHNGGFSSPSVATITTPAPPPAPDPVTNLVVTRPTTNTFKLTWTLPSGGAPRAGVMIRRSVPPADVAPTHPSEGVLVADLPADATEFLMTGLAGGTVYGLSVWTYRAEGVYSPPVSAQRRAAVDVSLFGFVTPGTQGTPALTSIRTDGPRRVGTFFQVTAAAELKGVRYWKATTAVVGGTGRVYMADIDRGPAFTKPVTDAVPFPSGGANSWVEAVFPVFVDLLPNVWYKAVVEYTGAGYPERTPYWGPGGYGEGAIRNGILRAGGTSGVPGGRTHNKQCSWDTSTNSSAAGPEGSGGPGGANWYADVIINPT